MHYELVSRALAYVSCISTMSLFLTSVAIAATNIGKPPFPSCAPNACVAGILVTKTGQFGALTSSAHVNKLAGQLWSAKA